MVPLYLFYIKAEEVYRLSRRGTLFIASESGRFGLANPSEIGSEPVLPPRTFLPCPRQGHYDRIGIVAGASACATGSLVDSMSSSSSGTADKPGSHELFERQQQLILTNCLNHPFVNVMICERVKLADLFYSLTVVAERDKLPDEITFRFARIPYVPPRGSEPKPPSMSYRQSGSQRAQLQVQLRQTFS